MYTEKSDRPIFIFRKMARPNEKGLWYFNLYFGSAKWCINDRSTYLYYSSLGNRFHSGLRHVHEFYKAAEGINRKNFCQKVETYSLRKISYDIVLEPDMKWALLNRKNKIKKYSLLADVLIEGNYHIDR